MEVLNNESINFMSLDSKDVTTDSRSKNAMIEYFKKHNTQAQKQSMIAHPEEDEKDVEMENVTVN